MRLEVAVEDAAFVCEFERCRHLVEDIQHPPGIERSLSLDRVRERLSADVLHRDVRHAFDFIRVEDRNDVRVVELRQPFPLDRVPVTERSVLCELR